MSNPATSKVLQNKWVARFRLLPIRVLTRQGGIRPKAWHWSHNISDAWWT